MRAAAAIALCATLACGQTSNVQTVKAWTRTHVMGLPGGTLLDPTGTLADAQRLAAASASSTAATGIVAAAQSGLAAALDRLFAAADRTNDFTGRLYLAADLDPDPGYEQVEAHQVAEVLEPGLTRQYVHFTRELAAPPKTLWAHAVGPGAVYWSAGEVATNNATTNVSGFACYDIRVPRPAEVGNVILRTHRYLKFGAPGQGLDIPEAGLRIISGGETNTPFTGTVTFTNAGIATTEIYKSGFLHGCLTNAVEVTP